MIRNNEKALLGNMKEKEKTSHFTMDGLEIFF